MRINCRRIVPFISPNTTEELLFRCLMTVVQRAISEQGPLCRLTRAAPYLYKKVGNSFSHAQVN